jgi:tetratricopeptide (TPR) repeat protein
VLIHKGELAEAETCLHEARGLFLAAGDSVGAASALWSLAHAASYDPTQLGIATRHNERALGELTRLGDRWGVARCLNTAGELARVQGELERAETHYRRAGEIMTALGAEDSASICEANVARVQVERGLTREARSQLEQSVRDFEQQGRHTALSWAHTVLLVCCAADRDWEQWDQHLVQVRTLLAQSGYLDLDIAQAAQMAADAALANEDRERACEAYQLSLAQWTALGRSEDAAKIQRKLDEIGVPVR